MFSPGLSSMRFPMNLRFAFLVGGLWVAVVGAISGFSQIPGTELQKQGAVRIPL